MKRDDVAAREPITQYLWCRSVSENEGAAPGHLGRAYTAMLIPRIAMRAKEPT